MYLIFDTETTGVRSDARITQLAFAAIDQNEDGTLTVNESYSSLIKPDGWEVPNERFFIENNMSTERCEKEGVPVAEVVSRFLSHANKCKYLIAHNIDFDLRMISYELDRLSLSLPSPSELQRICTMKAATNHCAIPGRRGYKWPKLEQLHNKLFDRGFDGAHDALADVNACGRCFFELKKLNIININ